jgi:hypothetical protein
MVQYFSNIKPILVEFAQRSINRILEISLLHGPHPLPITAREKDFGKLIHAMVPVEKLLVPQLQIGVHGHQMFLLSVMVQFSTKREPI